jgi:hypothetical protein
VDGSIVNDRLGYTSHRYDYLDRTVGNVSTVRQYKKFSSTDGEFFWTARIQALKRVSTAGTKNGLIVTEILY